MKKLSQITKDKIKMSLMGHKCSLKTRLKISLSNKGKNKGKGMWKGNKACYDSKHQWVGYYKGKPRKCENCGTEKAKKYEWINIDHKYRRVLDDYIRMCTSCHRKYDFKRNNYFNLR